jgi:cystathionine beta-lyase
VHTPTYIGFTNTLRNNGYHIVHSPLIYRETDGGAGSWYMDFEDMERKIRDNRIHAAVFCSPHNPCGRVWTKEELEQAFAIFAKYDVKVVSDEIWSDLILSGHRHIPVQSVSDYARENTVALYAPSKTFNLAGFVGSYHIIYNKTLRERVLKEASLSHYNDMNVLSMYALIGAYSAEGEAWLEELRRVLTGNTRYAVDYIRSRFEGVTLAEPEGTYMLFPDCTGWCGAHKKTLQELEHLCWQTGVALQDGKMFNGQCHLRINLALPLTRVREAMERLDRYVFNAQ